MDLLKVSHKITFWFSFSFLQYHCIIVKRLKTIYLNHLSHVLLNEVIFLGRDMLLDVHNHLIFFTVNAVPCNSSFCQPLLCEFKCNRMV